MLKNTFYYDHHSVRLQIEGLPDYSVGQNNNSIGIISSWKLQIAGFPQLEGDKDHLKSLIDVFYPYSRQYLYGKRAVFGELTSPVRIKPSSFGHELTLTSSKSGIEPLQFNIDDAELSDLITCLDKLKLDDRVNFDWDSNQSVNFNNRFLINNQLSFRKFSTPLFGLMFFLGISFALVAIYEDPLIYRNDTQSPDQSNVESPNN